MAFEASSTGYSVSDSPAPLSFGRSFDRTPVFLAGMQSCGEGDTANLRSESVNSTAARVLIDEEQSADTETSHATENVGYLALSSNTRTVVLGDTPDADYPGTIRDTFININQEVNVSSEQLNTYTWPENMPANAILLKADLSQIPEGATILQATLKLYQTAADGDASYEVSVHRIVNHNPDLARSNGYTYNGSEEWTANDACYNSIPLAQADIDEAVDTRTLDRSLEYKSWDVTGILQHWNQNQGSNFGMLLNSDAVASSNSHRYFISNESQEGKKRPKLKIIYAR
jgi:hypothetical protein